MSNIYNRLRVSYIKANNNDTINVQSRLSLESGLQSRVVTSSATAVSVGMRDAILILTSTSPVTVTLPLLTEVVGQQFTIVYAPSSASMLTLTASGSDEFDSGSGSLSIAYTGVITLLATTRWQLV